MKKRLLSFVLLLPILSFFGCKDPFFDGKFQVEFLVINETETTLFLKYEDAELDTTFLKEIKPGEDDGVSLGVYEGNKNEDMPPESYYKEKIQKVTIYRYLDNDMCQILPNTAYDRPESCHTYVNPEFVIYEAIYQFTVKESVFR